MKVFVQSIHIISNTRNQENASIYPRIWYIKCKKISKLLLYIHMLLEIFLDTYLKLTVKLPKETKTVHASMLYVVGNWGNEFNRPGSWRALMDAHHQPLKRKFWHRVSALCFVSLVQRQFCFLFSFVYKKNHSTNVTV